MTKRRRAGPSERSVSVSRWLSLPEDVLLRVLSLLDPQDLMTARLVCRQWRPACLACCKYASPSEWPDFQGASWKQQRTMLESRLQILTSLTAIELEISDSRDAALLNVPGCSAILKGIDVHFGRVSDRIFEQHGEAVRLRRVEALLAADLEPLASLTGLTRLFAGFSYTTGGRPGPLQAFFLDVASQILQQCTQLSEVRLYCRASEWMQLLPRLAGLPHLRVLENVPMGDDALLERVAALTQLTELSLSGWISFALSESLMCLTAMTALKALVLNPAPTRALSLAAPALTQLEMLALTLGHWVETPEVVAALTPLRGLTQLQVRRQGGDMIFMPRGLLQSCLTRLEVIRWDVVTVRGGSWHFSRNLRHLSICTPKRYGKALLEHVAALTGLVSLRLAFPNPPKRWSTAAKHNAPWRAATFLSGSTGLHSLNLFEVLHAGNMEEDVRCIAALTNLQSLGLHGKCSCHGFRRDHSSEDDWLSVRIWSAPNAIQEEGECPNGVKAFVRSGGFLQLLSLRSLKVLLVSGPWSCIKESGFPEALDGVRHEMGRPPLKVI